MNCSKCNSENIKSFEMICAIGTATGTSSSGLTVVSKSDLAKKCAPPTDWFRRIGAVLAGIAALIALPSGCLNATMAYQASFPINVLIGFVLAVLVAILITITFKFLSKSLGFSSRFELQKDEWQQSFMCLDCGNNVVLKNGVPL